MSFRHDIFNAAFDAANSLAGEDVVYTSGSSSFQLRATRGSTMFRESEVQRGGSKITRSADFLFNLVEFRMTVGGWAQPSDKIVATYPGGLTVTYRVSSINGEPCYRTDPTGSVLRVHTLEYSEE